MLTWQQDGPRAWCAIDARGVHWSVKAAGDFFTLYRNGDPLAVRDHRGNTRRRWRLERNAKAAAETAAG